VKLPQPFGALSVMQEADMRRAIEAADRENHKRGRDVDISPGRLILTSPNGTRYEVVVSNAGALSASAV